jgi:4-aminobutyrate aminotransferase-like enzyme
MLFGAQKYGYQPDIITSAKGLTSATAAGAANTPTVSSCPARQRDSCMATPSVATCVVRRRSANLDIFERGPRQKCSKQNVFARRRITNTRRPP